MSALGQKQTFAVQNGMSALPPIADMCSATRHVRCANSGHSVRLDLSYRSCSQSVLQANPYWPVVFRIFLHACKIGNREAGPARSRLSRCRCTQLGCSGMLTLAVIGLLNFCDTLVSGATPRALCSVVLGLSTAADDGYSRRANEQRGGDHKRCASAEQKRVRLPGE